MSFDKSFKNKIKHLASKNPALFLDVVRKVVSHFRWSDECAESKLSTTRDLDRQVAEQNEGILIMSAAILI